MAQKKNTASYCSIRYYGTSYVTEFLISDPSIRVLRTCMNHLQIHEKPLPLRRLLRSLFPHIPVVDTADVDFCRNDLIPRNCQIVGNLLLLQEVSCAENK